MVNSFCHVYEVEPLYDFEREEIIKAYEEKREITEPPQLRKKLENLAAHDKLDC